MLFRTVRLRQAMAFHRPSKSPYFRAQKDVAIRMHDVGDKHGFVLLCQGSRFPSQSVLVRLATPSPPCRFCAPNGCFSPPAYFTALPSQTSLNLPQPALLSSKLTTSQSLTEAHQQLFCPASHSTAPKAQASPEPS